MTEIPLRFGPESRLVGILTVPGAIRAELVGCLLFNAGVLHRVGPHRVNVKLARELAARGIPTLRMDLAGMGDSYPATGMMVKQDQDVADLMAGLSVLEREAGARRAAVVGFCSGALDGYATALRDTRVKGLFMYDGYAFPTFRTRIIRRWRQIRLSGGLAIVAYFRKWASRRLAGRSDAMQMADASVPSVAEFKRDIAKLVDRGTSVYLAYSGSDVADYNYATQLEDIFGSDFVSSVTYAYLPHLDHTLTTTNAQRELITRVADWAVSLSTGRPAEPASPDRRRNP